MSEQDHHYTFSMPEPPWHVAPRPLTIGIIPARGGSKGLPNKNILNLAGKPLIAHTIEQALNCSDLDAVVVSTEDEEIAQVSEEYGAEVVMRPKELAGDYSPSEDALIHVLGNFHPPFDTDEADTNWDICVMLQCTSPMRNPEDIGNCLDMVYSGDYDSVLSAVAMQQFVWAWEKGEAWAMNYNPKAMRPMRQQVAQFVENGSIYVMWTQHLLNNGTRLNGRIGIYEMPYWGRFEIDTLEDLSLLEWVMGRYG